MAIALNIARTTTDTLIIRGFNPIYRNLDPSEGLTVGCLTARQLKDLPRYRL